MRAHTASGTLLTRALAPEPTAAGFFGNRMPGSAPARGTGKRVAPTDVAPSAAAGVRDGVLNGAVVVAAVRGVGFGALLVPGAVEAVDVVVVAVRAGDVAALRAAGEPAPQPARTRQTRAPAVAVAG